MYQINGEHHVMAFLAARPADDWDAFLEWLPRLAADPEGVSSAVLARPGVPGFTALVPDVFAYVDYLVVEQFKTVLILGVTDGLAGLSTRDSEPT